MKTCIEAKCSKCGACRHFKNEAEQIENMPDSVLYCEKCGAPITEYDHVPDWNLKLKNVRKPVFKKT